MRKLTIRNIGPLKSAYVEFGRINIITGPQSSGKSCLMKILNYCLQVERQIQIEQSPKDFQTDNNFVKKLNNFFLFDGFLSNESYISYESDYLIFSYTGETGHFVFDFKVHRWDYLRSQFFYIPSERNLISVVSNLFDINLTNDVDLNFLSVWTRSRACCTKSLKLLNLNASYRYDDYGHNDFIDLKDKSIPLYKASSGIQNLVSIIVILNYIKNPDDMHSVKELQSNDAFLFTMYHTLFAKSEDKLNKMDLSDIVFKTINEHNLPFADSDEAEECKKIFDNFTRNNFSEVFIEEPENSLSQSTYKDLMKYLSDFFIENKNDTLFISTNNDDSDIVRTFFISSFGDDFKIIDIKKKDDSFAIESD